MLNKISFRYKLFLIPAVAVLALLFTMVMNYRFIQGNLRQLDALSEVTIPSLNMNRDLKKVFRQTLTALQAAVHSKDANVLRTADALRDQFLSLINGVKNNPAFNAEYGSDLKRLFEDYYTSTRGQAVQMIKNESSGKELLESELISKPYQDLSTRLDTDINALNQTLANGYQLLRNQNRSMLGSSFIAILLFLLVVVVLSAIVTPTFVKPLNIAIDVAEKVARGDLTVHVPAIEGNDEMANLLRVFRTMVENLRTLTEQIKEAVSSLASASTEISASVTEIASGATETATAANETSTTVEEVRQTALDANRKAKHVSESAQKAVQVSQAGEKAVIDMIEGIRRIESQMESIAESIMKLSEHGQAIGGIIATVEDVAEQSNLLAVNASIEAARAGEHGKGFAVVAHEVKSLAEQSKQSTSRVRNILDDIQKATSGAVMTTEQGSKAVEAGVKQSQDAGDSIQRLASSVEEAAQATMQIAVSSQEQLVGMDQVVAAMESIKQASAQNVTATKQVEASAHDLQDLGQRLKHLVEQYKL
jgi:methyl-accepting chemotaxis protein